VLTKKDETAYREEVRDLEVWCQDLAWVLTSSKRIYSCTIKSILTGYIIVWYGNCLAFNRKALQRSVRRAQYITGAKLPAIQHLYTRRCQR
jgi:hypothetical protein